jgi:hypothetical protein
MLPNMLSISLTFPPPRFIIHCDPPPSPPHKQCSERTVAERRRKKHEAERRGTTTAERQKRVMMKCKCGHEQDKHEQLNDDELACMVHVSDILDYTEYCPCMDFVMDEDAHIAALLAACNALNKALGILCGERIVCDASGELGEQVTGEAMDAWEKVTK